MSLCDTCMSPGACCKKLYLSGGRPDARGNRIGEAHSYETAEHLALLNGTVFRPSVQLPDGRWNYTCHFLQPDGRCGDYENRPDLCRRYLPGDDPLCVHYWKDPES